MKSLRNILNGLVLALTIGAVACTDNDPEDRFVIDTTEVTLDDGLAGEMDILIASNCASPAVAVDENAQEWLSAEIVQRCLTLRYTQNDTGEDRSGNVYITAGTISTTVTVTQAPYVAPKEGDYTVGEVYYEDGVAKGVVFWVDPADGTNAKVVSLKRVVGPWSSAATPAETGAQSSTDGAANTAVLRQSAEYADGKLAALTLCDELGEGWYWPAYGELVDLFEIYNADGDVDFDKTMTDNGGDAINTPDGGGSGDRYWSSTESMDPSTNKYINAYFVRVISMKPDGTVKKTSSNASNPRYLRCFKVLGEVAPAPEPCVVTPSKTKVELDGTSDATATVAVEVTNGHLSGFEAEPAASWLKIELKDNAVVFTTTEDNDTGAVRSTTVTLTATGDNGADDATCTIVVTQAMNVQALYTVGTAYEEDGTVVGIVFWVSDDGQSAKIVSLDRIEAIAWASSGSTASTTLLGATSTSDGAANTAILKESAEAASIPMLAFCEAHGEGWYWPAIDELTALFEAYNGTSYADATFEQPVKINETEKAARAAFDKLLTDNGGTALNTAAENNNGDAYIASTEASATNCNYFRFGKRYNEESATKSGTTRHGRCVKLIGKQ